MNLWELWLKIKLFLKNLNLFPSVPPSTDEHDLQNQRISTRLFILLLVISLTILLLYNSLVTITQTVYINSPSLHEYSSYYSSYPQTLTCACTQISISYETFIEMKYSFHQVCSSFLVTRQWIDYLATFRTNTTTHLDDFRLLSTSMFQALSSFCYLVTATVRNRLSQFYTTRYVSGTVTPIKVLHSQGKAFTSQFILSTVNDFRLSLTTIRNTTKSNALLSGQFTNYYLLGTERSYSGTASIVSKYNDCDCGSSSLCAYQSRIYINSSDLVSLYVSGMYTGCFVVEALLQSDLQCFYNGTCIDDVKSYFMSHLSADSEPLHLSLLVRFSVNSTIEQLLDQLMVEQWNDSIQYENYYSACNPSICTYTFETKNGAVYIVTTIIGLLGGLITVLRLIVPRAVKLVCSSFFVSEEWLKNYIGFNYFVVGEFIFDDFRLIGTWLFQVLSSFCQLINMTISNRLAQFYTTQYVSGTVTPVKVLYSQSKLFTSQFISSTTNEFILSLSTIRNTTQSNALISGQLTNYQLLTKTGTTPLQSLPRSYGDCSCVASSHCGYESGIHSGLTNTISFYVPGIYTACYPIEALLQSDLRCFYDYDCINSILSSMSYGIPMFWNLTAMRPSLLVRFSVNSTIEQLLDQLMVEQWNDSI
ncbi:unnamed protein product, partial [Adineta ricciae]